MELFLLFSRTDVAKEYRILRICPKKMSKIRHRRNTFGKIRRVYIINGPKGLRGVVWMGGGLKKTSICDNSVKIFRYLTGGDHRSCIVLVYYQSIMVGGPGIVENARSNNYFRLLGIK